MKRAVASVVLCAMALALGITTARLAARNRALADELAERHHESDVRERQNDLMHAENERVEWSILQELGTEPDATDTTGAREDRRPTPHPTLRN